MAKTNFNLGNFQTQLEPLLKPLDHKAKRVAMEVCLAYRTREIFLEDLAVQEQLRQLRTRARGSIRALKKLRKSLTALKSEVGFLCDPVREVHIPKTVYDLLASTVPKTPPLDYFRRQSVSDPAQALVDLYNMISTTERLIGPETEYIRQQIAGMQKTWKYPLNPFWRSGSLEYTLMRLFRERTKHRFSVSEAEKLTARILMLLDGGGRTPDAIRVAAKRVETLPKYCILRQACDTLLNYRFKPSHRY